MGPKTAAKVGKGTTSSTVKGMGGKSKKSKEEKRAAENDGVDGDDDDDDAPEVVSSSSAEIQRLRELHEQMVAPSKKSKKRKAPSTLLESGIGKDKDKALDASVLEGLSVDDLEEEMMMREEQEAEEERQEREELERQEAAKIASGKKIDIDTRKSRKIGHISVQVLDRHNPIDAFMSAHTKGVLAMNATLTSQPRTRFAVFAAQKGKAQPAKKFSR